jgi:SpoVK/Ycf46/Vps4 family AAA+-type ATPase
MDPTKEEDKNSSESYAALIESMKKNGRKVFKPANDYETRILNDIVFPDQISITWNDVGGLETLKEQIYETLVLPLQNPGLFKANRKDPSQASLAVVPRGVLFYGPPGTGKTMLAKVIAKECGATFINVSHSTVQNKWWGESQKLVRALFTTARKCAPTIIFIDEIDMFFRERSSSDHEASTSMKSEFMSLWDGMTTADDCGVTILAATNHPRDIDVAILRRLPRTFCFELPTVKERKLIIDVQLRNQRVDENFDVQRVATKTEGYSGSDLKEVCKYACMLPINRVIHEHCVKDGLRPKGEVAARTALGPGVVPKPLSNHDMDLAVEHVRKTGEASFEYKKPGQAEEGDDGKPRFDMPQAEFEKLMRQLMQGVTALPAAAVDEQDLPPVDDIED